MLPIRLFRKMVHRRSAENPESTETSFLNKARKAGVFGIERWYVGVVLKVLVLSVVFDGLWYAKMTFGES